MRACGGDQTRRRTLSEPVVTDRQGIGFGWLQNAWLLHARLKIHRGGIDPRLWPTQKTRGGSNHYNPSARLIWSPQNSYLGGFFLGDDVVSVV
eukprot:COSAG01_NODE_42568_length_438_cov_4.097345_1_plen_93_part_00